MIHINFPIKCYSEEAKEKLLNDATYHPIDVSGKFVRKMKSEEYDVFMFEFTSAIRASNAKLSDFVLKRKVTGVDSILSPIATTAMYLHVDFEIIRRRTYLEQISIYRETLSQLSACLESATSEEAMKIVKSLDAAMEANSKIPPLHLGEYAINQLICEQIADTAKSKGYIVRTNKSVFNVSCTNKVSKYFSRPDLVIYHPNRLRASIITAPCEEEPEESSHPSDEIEPNVTIRGGTTEHKQDISGTKDIMGQLLAGMEKVAGEIALEYIQTSDSPIFTKIEVYGLIVDLEKQVCTAHKLSMDLDTNSSSLKSSAEELGFSEGINRLLETLII